MKRLATAATAAALIAATTFAARAQNNVISYLDFVWLNYSQATCLQRGEDAVNQALSAFGITGATTRVADWSVLANTPDLNFWIFCVAAADGLIDANAQRVLVIASVNSGRADIDGALRDYLRDCMDTGCPDATPPTTPTAVETIGWGNNAITYRGRNGERISLFCPPRGNDSFRPVWGTDIYTDDSSICTAAVHVGAITTDGGVVTIEILPGQTSYTGTERNGVSTSNWGTYSGSFRFVAAVKG